MSKQWAYMIVFEPRFASRKQIQEFLDTVPEVTYWYACLPNCVFTTASMSAHDLAKALESKFDVSSDQKFFVCEVHSDRQGRLPKEAWRLLDNPENPRLTKG